MRLPLTTMCVNCIAPAPDYYAHHRLPLTTMPTIAMTLLLVAAAGYTS